MPVFLKRCWGKTINKKKTSNTWNSDHLLDVIEESLKLEHPAYYQKPIGHHGHPNFCWHSDREHWALRWLPWLLVVIHPWSDVARCNWTCILACRVAAFYTQSEQEYQPPLYNYAWCQIIDNGTKRVADWLC